MTAIAHRRLRAQHLIGPLLATPVDVVRHLGAVQAQDYPGALWAIAQRSRGGVAAATAAFASGAIVRAHVLRPTWHLVVADDLAWMQALTAPRVHALNAFYYRQQDLDARALARGDGAIVRAVEGGPQTRAELAAALAKARLPAAGLRLALLVMHAELGGLIASGPMRGKQHTYARAPAGRARDRDDALAALAIRYVTGHGPAGADDLAWWSGLTVADARCAIALAGDALVRERIGERDLYRAATAKPMRYRGPTAQLLPNYDEYVVAFKDRSAFHDPARLAGARALGLFDRHLIVVDGMLVGGWRPTRTRDHVALALRLLITPTAGEQAALDAAVARYGAAHGVAVTSARAAR